MEHDQLINKEFHILQRNKVLKDRERFIYNQIYNNIIDSLDMINFSIKNCLEIGVSSNILNNYITSRFEKIDYFSMDISKKLLNSNKSFKKICMDHDEWKLNNKKFDLIISNLYLNLSNNFDLLLKNIINSLNRNGFLIASIPSINCFKELENCMQAADIEMYNGIFKRFNTSISIDTLNKILKKHNFKIPVIEIDILKLKYKKFSQLLKDIRYIGGTYIYNDSKKKFENKKYFKKVEEIYWNKYSEDNMLISNFEIIYFSGWKEDDSQQKPLKPGEAKNSLRDFLK